MQIAILCILLPLAIGQTTRPARFQARITRPVIGIFPPRPPVPVRTTVPPAEPSPLAFIGSHSMVTGEEYILNIYVIDRLQSNVNVKIELYENSRGTRGNNNQLIETKNVVIPAGNTRMTPVRLRPRRTDRNVNSYRLKTSCDTVNCAQSIDSIRAIKTTGEQIFVQTDKPKYKAGDEIKFRAVVVRPDFKPPTNELLTVIIKDPKDNIVRKWANQTLNKGPGVFGSSMQLSEDPSLGTWKIMVEAVGKERTVNTMKTVKVEEYVLPKYEVSIDMEPFHVIPDGEFNVNINAKYTHGGGVAGTALVTISHFIYYCSQSYITRSRIIRPNRCGQNATITQKTDDGKIELNLKNSYLLARLPSSECQNCVNDDLNQQTFEITVEYTEDFTKIDASAKAKFKAQKNSASLRIAPLSPRYYRPGLVYNGYAMVEKVKGVPLTDRDLVDSSGRRRQVSVSFSTCTRDCTSNGPRDNCQTNSSRLFDIGANGLVPFEIPAIDNRFDFAKIKISFTDKYGQEIETETTINPFCQGKAESLKLSMNYPSGGIKEQTNLRFNIVTTTPVNGAYYSIISDNKIVYSGRVFYAQASTSGIIDLWLSSDLYRKMMPSAKVMAWAFTSDAAFIADTVMVKLDVKLPNQVSLQFSTDETRPGRTVRLDVQASPDSYVGILGVDKSVNLLGGGYDITQEDVEKSFANPGNQFHPPIFPGPIPMPRIAFDDFFHSGYNSIPGSNIPDILRETGVFLLSSATQCNLQAKICPYNFYPVFNQGFPGIPGATQTVNGPVERAGTVAPGGVAPNAPDAPREDGGGTTTPEAAPQTVARTEFPETWLWMDETVGSDGRKSLSVDLPDTITTWIATGFAMGSTGFGVAAATSLVATKPFFISLTLPYSVVNEEEFLLQALVFNYLNTEQQVALTLRQSSSFVTLENKIESSQDVTRAVMVPAGRSKGVSFLIKPNTFGNIDIELQALSSAATDALRRKLLVKPEGTEETQVKSMYLALSPPNSFQTSTFDITLPSNVVRGSERFSLSVCGSVMGPVAENLGKWSKKPYGCGEQNMINFVPNILVLKYMKSAGISNDALKEKALGYVMSGYQREMNYLRDDGSYSSFGKRSKHGNLWLTAFVLKSYAEAFDFIGEEIDKDAMTKSIKYVLSRLSSDGKFEEEVASRNSFLKGGVGSDGPLAAYIVIMFTIVKTEMPMPNMEGRIDQAIAQSTAYLKREFYKFTKPYDIAIVTYALALNKMGSQVNALARLDSVAPVSNGEQTWGGVEATSYGMLAKLAANPSNTGGVLPALKWLVKQFGKGYGFSSTQDTVVGLAALSRFATLTPSAANTDLNIRAVADTGEQHSFTRITRSNKEVFQIYRFSTTPRRVTITASSSGSAIIQLEADYNILEPDNTTDLTVKVDSETDTIAKVYVKTCVKWNKVDDSGMAIVEINPLSGYEIKSDKLLEEYADQGLKKVEIRKNKLITYWEEVNSIFKCFNITQFQVAKVNNIQPAEIRAYSYYADAKERKSRYKPSGLSKDDPCSFCPQCCASNSNNQNNNNNNGLTNVALRKTATQSNTYFGDGIVSFAINAIDGCKITDYSKGCCTHTKLMDNHPSWWNVDLGREHYVQNVTIYKRMDCCSWRNRNIEVAMSNTGPPPENQGRGLDLQVLNLCTKEPEIFWEQMTFTCNNRGRFVYVFHRQTKDFLSLCEVEVYGRL